MADEPFAAYSEALAQLRGQLQGCQPDVELLSEFETLAGSLRDSLEAATLFGDTPQLQHDRARIKASLDSLARRVGCDLFSTLYIWAAAEPHSFSSAGLDRPDNPGAAMYVLPAHAESWPARIRSSGYHLIVGEPGFGKSALIAHLANIYRADTPPFVIGYMFSRSHGRTSVKEAQHSLIRDLVALVPDMRGMSVARARFEALLKQAAAAAPLAAPELVAPAQQAVRLLILIDAIDECLDAERPYLWELLPSPLPPNVSVVIATRLDIQAHLLKWLSHHRLHQSHVTYKLGTLEHDDIVRLLASHGVVDAVGQPATSELAGLIAERSSGFPRSASEHCQNVADDLRANLEPRLRLWASAFAAGQQAHLAIELRHLERDCGGRNEQDLASQLICLMAVAHAPLTLEEAGSILKLAPGALGDLLGRLGRYLLLRQDGLQFANRSFAEFLYQRPELSDYVGQAQRQLNDWLDRHLASDATQQLLPYAARYSIAQVNEVSQLLSLLRGEGWSAQLRENLRQPASWRDSLLLLRTRLGERFAKTRSTDQRAQLATLLVGVALLLATTPRAPQAELEALWEVVEREERVRLELLVQELRAPLPQIIGPPPAATLAELLKELPAQNPAPHVSRDDDTRTPLLVDIAAAWLHSSSIKHVPQILHAVTPLGQDAQTALVAGDARVQLLDALAVLAPALRYYLPKNVELLEQLITAVIDTLP